MEIRTPRRVTRTFTQHLAAEPSRGFPLLCPVREADWIEGWDPVLVWSASGVAERDCVFVTAGESAQAIWFIIRHEPESGFLEMLKITPGVTACRLSIQLRGSLKGTDAAITYSHTSLGPAGDDFVEKFTEEHYRRFVRDWESRLDHYLITGEALHLPPV